MQSVDTKAELDEAAQGGDCVSFTRTPLEELLGLEKSATPIRERKGTR